MPSAELFRVLTDPLDRNRFQVHNMGVLEPVWQTKLPTKAPGIVAETQDGE
jgi:hypothetical protein